MKRTFIVKTFGARSFRSATLAGAEIATLFRPVRAALFVAGAAAGRNFLSGSCTGQHYQTGATAGTSHG